MNLQMSIRDHEVSNKIVLYDSLKVPTKSRVT